MARGRKLKPDTGRLAYQGARSSSRQVRHSSGDRDGEGSRLRDDGRSAYGPAQGRARWAILLLLAEQGVDVAPLAEEADRLRADGATAIFMGADCRVAAIFAITDPVKPSTPEALAALNAQGIRVVMLTGDNWTTAKAVARQLGIDEVEAEVLPDQRRARSCSGTGPRAKWWRWRATA